MQQKQHYVQGNVAFPLVFPIKAKTKSDAIEYASGVLNNVSVTKVEIEFHTSDGKIHLAICDEFELSWRS